MFSWSIILKYHHSAAWYIGALILVISLVIWGIFTGIYALSIAVVIFAGVYLLIENNAPESVEAVVNENGIGVDQEFFHYGQIKSFSLIFDNKKPRFLSIHIERKFSNIIQIPLTEGVNVSELRSFLQGYLEESGDGKISLSDRIGDTFGL